LSQQADAQPSKAVTTRCIWHASIAQLHATHRQATRGTAGMAGQDMRVHPQLLSPPWHVRTTLNNPPPPLPHSPPLPVAPCRWCSLPSPLWLPGASRW
jgi:hypothetical protein